MVVKHKLRDAIAVWEGEGGSAAPREGRRMIGTVNQIAWAEQIKAKVGAEFDRVRRVLESAATKRPAAEIQALVRILEDKRREVMGNEQAGYFIHDWQELADQVRRLIVADARYKTIKAGQTQG